MKRKQLVIIVMFLLGCFIGATRLFGGSDETPEPSEPGGSVIWEENRPELCLGLTNLRAVVSGSRVIAACTFDSGPELVRIDLEEGTAQRRWRLELASSRGYLLGLAPNSNGAIGFIYVDQTSLDEMLLKVAIYSEDGWLVTPTDVATGSNFGLLGAAWVGETLEFVTVTFDGQGSTAVNHVRLSAEGGMSTRSVPGHTFGEPPLAATHARDHWRFLLQGDRGWVDWAGNVLDTTGADDLTFLNLDAVEVGAVMSQPLARWAVHRDGSLTAAEPLDEEHTQLDGYFVIEGDLLQRSELFLRGQWVHLRDGPAGLSWRMLGDRRLEVLFGDETEPTRLPLPESWTLDLGLAVPRPEGGYWILNVSSGDYVEL